MALVKTTRIAPGKGAEPRPRSAATAPKAVRPVRASGLAKDKLSERIGAATEQLAAGLAEASASAEELRRAMEQIAGGAEEAAGASQEQSAAMRTAAAALVAAREQADGARRRTEALQVLLAETSVQIGSSVRAIERNAQRQESSIEIIAELERRALDIADITRTVSRIADQTGLLALNAAIEAARAGDHGRGFAVVAEEVRALAEASDRSSQDVGGLAQSIQADVQTLAAAIRAAAQTAAGEARSGAVAVEALDSIRADMATLAESSHQTLTAALEAERAAAEGQRGAEQVASAAEQQSAAAAEAQAAVQQQTQSLEQGQLAAQRLAAVSEQLQSGRSGAALADEIAATAEELSASIQELSGAATQIMAAVTQISRGAALQASATEETAAAMAQIETTARQAKSSADVTGQRVAAIETALVSSRSAIEQLVTNVDAALADTRSLVGDIGRLEGVGRRIQKIVDEITLIVVQTSMLAVSGSVEAARAGASGRGFAVVSSDVRNLAREAAESVGKIKETVAGILDQIATLRRELDQLVVAGEVEVQNNRQTFAVMAQLDGDVAVLKTAGEAISRGAEEILVAVVQAAAGARQIASAAEEAGGAAEQASGASGEQARGAEDLAAAIEEIASLADELKRGND
jgi:methyl-accepting chemotaxis protein